MIITEFNSIYTYKIYKGRRKNNCKYKTDPITTKNGVLAGLLKDWFTFITEFSTIMVLWDSLANWPIIKNKSTKTSKSHFKKRKISFSLTDYIDTFLFTSDFVVSGLE